MVNCPACSQPISAGVVCVNGVDMHPKCFVCYACGHMLNVNSYERLSNNKNYCTDCVDKDPKLYQLRRKDSKKNLKSNNSMTVGQSTGNTQKQINSYQQNYRGRHSTQSKSTDNEWDARRKPGCTCAVM